MAQQNANDDLAQLSGQRLRDRATQQNVDVSDLDDAEIDAGVHDDEIRRRVQQAQGQQAQPNQ